MDLDPDFIEPLKKHVEIAFEKEAPSYQVPFKQTKIYVASRTQKQIDQMVKELREKSPYRPKMSIMGSRDHYCINSKVSKADDKNDACDDAVSNGSCFYHKGFQKIVDAEEFKAQGSSCVWDIEDLKAAGKKKRGCPYFASRDMAARADIVFLPYNYLIDPFIREACDIVLDDAIVIIDEAHNIESVATDAASVQIDERILDESLRRLKAEVNEITFEHYQKLAVPVAGIKRWLDNTCAGEEGFVDQGTISRSKILTGMDAISAFKEFGLTMDVHSTLLNSLKQVTPKGGDQEKTEIEFLPKRVCNFLNSILYILKTFSSGHWKEYRVIMTQYTADEDNGRNGYNAGEKLIHFHCMNPAVAFEDLTQKTKSIILTSGTLSPLASFSSELGVDFAYTVEAPHAVERDQIWIGAVPKSPSGRVMKGIYTEFNRFEYQDELGESILRICSVIPDGILVFLPSYSLLSNLERRWTQTKLIRKMGVMKDIYIEPRTNAKGAFDNLLVDFGESISSGKGGIIFCIYRGKMSEGIDFKDERARAVVCVGIPYPNIKDIRVQQKKEYNNMFSKSKGLVNGNAWVEIQAFRALNQALGRCIRHKSDWGAMIFLESRFCDSNHTISNLPKWTRASTKQY
ncbi:helicase C-terminal domain-containing protein, partial [Gorgonomyces haynaldii]